MNYYEIWNDETNRKVKIERERIEFWTLQPPTIKKATTVIGYSDEEKMKLAREWVDGEQPANWEENNERMDVIGQNGNDGLHYDYVDDE